MRTHHCSSTCLETRDCDYNQCQFPQVVTMPDACRAPMAFFVLLSSVANAAFTQQREAAVAQRVSSGDAPLSLHQDAAHGTPPVPSLPTLNWPTPPADWLDVTTGCGGRTGAIGDGVVDDTTAIQVCESDISSRDCVDLPTSMHALQPLRHMHICTFRKRMQSLSVCTRLSYHSTIVTSTSPLSSRCPVGMLRPCEQRERRTPHSVPSGGDVQDHVYSATFSSSRRIDRRPGSYTHTKRNTSVCVCVCVPLSE